MHQDGGARATRLTGRLLAGAATLLVAAPFLAMLPAQAAVPAAPHAARGPSLVEVAARPAVPAGDTALGAVPAATVETGMVVLEPRDEAAVKSFVADVTDERSPLFHDYLAAGAYAARFGPTRSTIAAVESTLRADGLTVAGVAGDGLFVTFSGAASTIERAFHTGLERYRLADGSIGFGTTGAIRLPSRIAGAVSGVVGLDDLVAAQPADVRPGARSAGTAAAASPHFTHPAGAPDACTLAVQDAETSGGLTDDAIADAYGAFGLYGAGDFGQGEHVAVYELQPFLVSDIETFDTCYFGATEAAAMSGTGGDPTGSRLSIVPVDGGLLQPGAGSENDEATLDVEDVSALAPESRIDVYEAPNTTFGGLDEYTQIVDDDVDQVVTSSWALCEQLAQFAEPGLQDAENLLFEQAAAQGQTVLSAAGDTGDDACNEYRYNEPPPGQNLLSELDPGSQPYVVSVGGTTIDDATQPPSEHVWNDGAEWGGGGGGISETWTMPSWQVPLAETTAGSDDVANAEELETEAEGSEAPFATPTFCDGTLDVTAPCREVPDVSAEADEFTGAVTIYGQSLGYGNPNGWTTIGGTSSATPIWAAMITLVNASTGCSGDVVDGVQDVGFVAPLLYGIAADATAYAASFHDVTSGNNDIYGLDDGLSFEARAGYDMASGLGSPQLTTPSGGNALAYYLCHYGTTLAPPTVASLSPTDGSTAGGETVTVTGSGFGTSGPTKVVSVQVGSGHATGFSVVDSTTLTVVLPAADTTTPAGSPAPQDGAGPAHISVTDESGQTSPVSAGSVFEYVDETGGGATVPSVTGLSPYGGLDTAPGTVTVFGSGFSGTPTVKFGGVAGSGVTVVDGWELTVTPPKLSQLTTGTACPTDTGSAGDPLSPTDDVCQVEVTVTESGHTSSTATILPPYEGPLEFDYMGGEILPSGCGCEDEPQPTEFDYVPAPKVTSVSTGTVGELPVNAGDLASEFGGAVANTVTVSGSGFDPLTFEFATLGLPLDENSMFYPVQESGTSFVLDAPALIGPGETATNEPLSVPVGMASLAGDSSEGAIVYAGVPFVTDAVDTATGLDGVPDAQSCPTPPPASGCGTPLTLTGSGFLQASGPIFYADNITGFSLGTQYSYDQRSDTDITTQSLAMNPAVVDVEVCSNSGCASDPPADFLYVYPPGNPSLSALSPASGPAHGGNTVVIRGSNLGCATDVKFGSVVTYDVTNAQALLLCGQTGEIVVTVPPGQAGQTVKVSVGTVESAFTGSKSNTLDYTYTASTPSAPAIAVAAGAATATVTWHPPATDGGSAISHYDVAATATGLPTVAASVPASGSSYVFRYLQPGVPYSFTVQAVNSLGAGIAAHSFPTPLGPGDNGYLIATADGAVFGYGSLTSAGGHGGGRISGSVIGIAPTPDAFGYFEATSTGAVYPLGNAGYYGQPTLPSGVHVVGIAATSSGRGYWLVTDTGVVYAYGDARSYGNVSGATDVVGIAPTADGRGYYVAEADGTVKALGDAVFRGDMAGKPLHKPIVGVAVNPANGGYWLVGGDGGIFAFGGAGYDGSMIGQHLNEGAVGMAPTPDGRGYWIVAADTGVFTFGSARYAGNGVGEAESAGVGIAAA